MITSRDSSYLTRKQLLNANSVYFFNHWLPITLNIKALVAFTWTPRGMCVGNVVINWNRELWGGEDWGRRGLGRGEDWGRRGLEEERTWAGEDWGERTGGGGNGELALWSWGERTELKNVMMQNSRGTIFKHDGMWWLYCDDGISLLQTGVLWV